MEGTLAALAWILSLLGVGISGAPDTPAASSTFASEHTVAVVEPRVSINAVDAELAFLLREIGLQAKRNIVLLSPTDKRLTVNLDDVPFSRMIRHISAMCGLSFLEVDETFVIGTSDVLSANYPEEWSASHPLPPLPAGKFEIVTETYKVNYVDPRQIAATLTELFKAANLSVIAGPASRTPTISSNQQTDQKTGIEASVMSESSALPSDYGRTLILRGSQEVVQAAIDAAKKMDVPRPQVSIGVTIHDISNEAVRELGLSWSYGDIVLTEQSPDGVEFGSFSRAPQTFTAKIKALEQEDKAKLLAAPNVTVLDGERAFVLIGTRLNFPVLLGFSDAGTPIFDRQEERVGIYLQVAATVSDDGQITLSLYPQVSVVTSFLEINGASYPQISTREAQTSIRVKTGDTIVIGGMLKDEEVHTIEKVPILSDIPVLGELFKRRKRSKISSQVIITITPRIIEERKEG
ncbi:MAG: secretin N-terminal domain-containing protein [Armatimonadota bacterium]